jgi:hypothetical protein
MKYWVKVTYIDEDDEDILNYYKIKVSDDPVAAEVEKKFWEDEFLKKIKFEYTGLS